MRNRNIFEGRCGHRPLQTASEKRNILPFRVVGVDAHIDPQENARFMVVFRRIGFDFPFYTVGADDPVRPPEMPVFTEIRCKFTTFQWADATPAG